MNNSTQEIEVKFYLQRRAALEERLQNQGATLIQPRVHELNLRFDTPERSLTREKRVLRLRQDEQARLTYKGPGYIDQDVTQRLEIEFAVSDFESARAFLYALGYEVSIYYEKFRTTYAWQGVLVTLDEMPYGDFSEIEGPDAGAIQQAAQALGLHWEARILDSYLALFERLRQSNGLSARNLAFAELEGLTCTPRMLGVQPGD